MWHSSNLFVKGKDMANPILRAILSSLLIWGSSLLVPHYLYAQGTVTFTDVTTQAGLPGFSELNSSWCVAWGDYDGDGFIDLITLGHIQDLTGSISQLWHNNGDGTFTDVTTQVGLDPHNGDAMVLSGPILIMMAVWIFLSPRGL
jgi:hypothetical protein